MKGRLSIGAAAILLAAAALAGQATISEQASAFYSWGLAAPEQALASSEDGVYSDRKNGYSVQASLGVKAKVADVYELFFQLGARSRIGSAYVPLELPSQAPAAFGASVEQAYARLAAFDALALDIPLDLNVYAGKFAAQAKDSHVVTRYRLESALGMIKLAGDANLGLEFLLSFSDPEQYFESGYSYLSLLLAAGGLLDESVPRLYDADGSISRHGKPVPGEYAPALLASLRLANYVLPFGVLSCEAAYALNGAGIYSGHSAGISSRLDLTLSESGDGNYDEGGSMSRLSLPIGLGAAYYEKNIDALAGMAGTGLKDDTTGMRASFRAGAGIGLHYEEPFMASAEINLGASFSYVEHLYRDPLALAGLSLDARYAHEDKLVAGAGLILASLWAAEWKTRDGVTALFDDFGATYDPARNLGFEAYAGIMAGNKCEVVLGINNNKGLSMNYGLQSQKDGLRKIKQAGTDAAEGLYETFGVFVRASMRM